MTRKYYYITTGADWHTTTQVFIVAIGSSCQGKRDLEALRQHAADNGDFFQIVSRESDEFYHRVIISISGEDGSGTHVSSRDLVRFFKHGIALTLSSGNLAAENQQRMILNLDYRISSKLYAERQRFAKPIT